MFPMDQVCAHCMSPDNAEIPFAAIDNVLIEPAQRARSFNPCANCAAGGGKLVKSCNGTLECPGKQTLLRSVSKKH